MLVLMLSSEPLKISKQANLKIIERGSWYITSLRRLIKGE